MTSAPSSHPQDAEEGHPTAAEMAAAEAELQAIGSADPLPAATVDRLLRGPFASTPAAAAKRSPVRILATAAVLALAVSGIAWAGMRIVWPGQQHSATTLPLADAIELATEPNRDDLARRSAIGVIFDHAGYGAESVARACADTDPDVAATAATIRATLLQKLEVATATPPVATSFDVVAGALRVLDRTAPTPARIQALEELGQAIAHCLQAANVARLASADGERMRNAGLANLRDVLSR
ncbi:MAG: hypothetical protein JNK15_20135 [Planctomycetes bacterium]|nr:hypothetical protein [Planctomycetota bacterium]